MKKPRSFVAAVCLLAGAAPAHAAAPTLSMMEQRRAQLWETGLYDAPGHPRLGKPQAGEWLASFPFGKLPAGTIAQAPLYRPLSAATASW